MLQDKRILVFGTSSQISIEIVNKLKSEGADVSFVVQSEFPKEDYPILDQVHCLTFDYYQVKEMTTLFQTALVTGRQPFDGIVFAGGIGGVRPIKLSNPEFTETMFQANVFSFVEIVRNASKRGVMTDGASIVAISSVSSVKGLKSKSIYSASKAALEALVRSLATELADRKIRVNAIQKGWVTSDMDISFIRDNMAIGGNDDFSRQLLGAIEPVEIANLVSFLMSDQVKSLTGTSIVLDGGYTL